MNTMPNGNDTGYHKEWCDERHDRIDTGLERITERLDKYENRLCAIELGQTELKATVTACKASVDGLAGKFSEPAQAENAAWRKLVPWLITALLAGGGGTAILREAVSPAPAAPAAQAASPTTPGR